MDPGGNLLAAELVDEDGEAADAIVAVDIREIAAALEQAGDCGGGGSGRGFVELGFRGLGD